jgi:hypothetical protein
MDTPSYPKKRVVFITVIVVILLIISLLIYKNIVGIEKKLTKLTPSEITNSTIQKTDDNIALQHLKGHPLEQVLRYYNKQQKAKALFVSLGKNGKYAYGYSIAQANTKVATQKAFEYCEKERKKRKIKPICTPYLINNNLSSNIINP